MLTREQALEAVEAVTALYTAGEVAVRDVMVKDRQVSLTVLVASEEAKPSLEAALREALARLGAETVHCRFRALEPAAAADASAQRGAPSGGGGASAAAGAGAAGPVQGHGAGLANPLLDSRSGVQFIAVASGKGGVGKSTVTVNLAVALARKGKRVGIIDADIYGFSVPDMMGIEERPQVVNERVIPIEKFGVKVMSMGFFVEDNSPIVWRGPMLGKMLRNFFDEIEWGQLDYLLLDLPPGTGDVALDVHQIIPQSKEIIVTTPHATAAFVAARAGAMAIKTEHEIIGIVENMAYYKCSKCGEPEYIFGRGGGGRLAESLHAELLSQIPLGAPDNHPSEPDFSPSVYKAESETGQLYLELADKVLQKCE
ncbi:ATP-binding protein involved in chromosome partitioning [Paenibacillus algorifonticola]|uniref:Iron-sulfur cluster carrier protein n=1 Tax=Paenibacillus algorifonticola TaxID=684063 RepID=A0A1I2I2N3_9BACL|nr:Mrp/NBP35 family ATP-binding protein [Paenibacillus algorifonticola]SFF36444.1 ATP-binding protein involved in chromosome partitioning [Paenibacillus algorifonticola]